MSKLPKEVGRIYKRFDFYGWFMCIIGLLLLCRFGGIGGIFGHEKNWWMLLATFLLFFEYVMRVVYGRVYKIVYYDTIHNPLYEISVEDRIFFVNAPSEEDLEKYMELHYPKLEFKIKEIHTESYIKTEEYL